MSEEFDIFIVGGGVNGCGIARDAAGRGYKVGLAEMNDLASGTSSASSKLVHGGLRYLEYYEFRLVREALGEREVLLRMAPNIIRPMRFVLPYHKGLRPAWMLRLGLFLYDHMGKRRLLPAAKTVDLRNTAVGQPLKPGYRHGFEYSDCWVDDARLVVLNARDAADLGASIRVRTKVESARREGERWQITLRDLTTGEERPVSARILVNAAGPWIDHVLEASLGSNGARNVRLVQGSHIVVPRLYEHDRAYLFQNADGRIIFVIPYEERFSLIGTTDVEFQGDPSDAKITPEETAYLCRAASEYFTREIHPREVVWAYSGVRPLYDDGASVAQEATRDYVLRIDGGDAQPAVINIFGGKITTYRKLAEAAMEKIEDVLGAKKPAWTAASALPGGDFPAGGAAALAAVLRKRFSFLDARFARRLVRAYGTRAKEILGNAKTLDDLGVYFGVTLTEREVEYLVQREWATTTEDILWRRSKLGLHMSRSEIDRLDEWLKRSMSGITPTAV